MTGTRVTIYTSSEWRRDNSDFVCLLLGCVVVVGVGCVGGGGCGWRGGGGGLGASARRRQLALN